MEIGEKVECPPKMEDTSGNNNNNVKKEIWIITEKEGGSEKRTGPDRQPNGPPVPPDGCTAGGGQNLWDKGVKYVESKIGKFLLVNISLYKYLLPATTASPICTIKLRKAYIF